MKRTILILMPLIALSLTAMAQDKGNQNHTGGLYNGRGWKHTTEDIKSGYVLGYRDHWAATVEALSKIKGFPVKASPVKAMRCRS